MLQLTPLDAACRVLYHVYDYSLETRQGLDSLTLGCSEQATGLALCCAVFDVPNHLKSHQVAAQLREKVYAPLGIEIKEVTGSHAPTDYAFLEQLGLVVSQYRRTGELHLPF